MNETKESPKEVVIYDTHYAYDFYEEVKKQILSDTYLEDEDGYGIGCVREKVANLKALGYEDLVKHIIDEFCQDWVQEQSSQNYQDFIEEIKSYDSHASCEGFVMIPYLGLWTGEHKGTPKRYDTLKECIEAICNSCNNYELKVTDCEGCFNVELSHHDGTNNFRIFRLESSYYTGEGDAEEEEIDDDYLYDLGHPSSDRNVLLNVLSKTCRELCFDTLMARETPSPEEWAMKLV
jgi:hypothetical protein